MIFLPLKNTITYTPFISHGHWESLFLHRRKLNKLKYVLLGSWMGGRYLSECSFCSFMEPRTWRSCMSRILCIPQSSKWCQRGNTTDETCPWDWDKWEMVLRPLKKNSHKVTRVLIWKPNDLVENLWITTQGWNYEEGRKKDVTVYTAKWIIYYNKNLEMGNGQKVIM